MTDMGLWAPTVSEKYGGSGMNVTMATIAAEELGRAEISLALPVMYLVQASWGFIFERYAARELKARSCPRSPPASCSWASPPPSRAAAPTSRASPAARASEQPDGNWMLNGEKLYISGIKESLRMGGIYMTLVRTDPRAGHKGFTFFAVDLKDNPQRLHRP